MRSGAHYSFKGVPMLCVFRSRFTGGILTILLFLSCYSSGIYAQTNLNPFSYTGAVQTFTVPACVNTIHVKAWGGGASGGGSDNYNGAAGGGGAFIQTDIAVVPGQVLTIIVGGGGGAGRGCVTGTGGGPAGWGNGLIAGADGGNAGGSGCSGGGGGGGGGSGVFNGATPMVVAGGGGGGSGGGQFSSGALGGGGGVNGNSVAGSCTNPGITGASANGNGTVGANKGGADGGGGGGGGGGYLGGTGGGVATACDCGACGGAGGSSWSGGINITINNGSGQTPGNSADPDLPAGDAAGGGGSTSGGNGFLLISYATPIPIVATVTSSSNPSCFNSGNGSITATASGGSGGGLTYSWNPSGQTTLTATGLGPGTYTLTVSDNSGCPVVTTQTLTSPPQLLSSAAGIDATCFGKCNGQVICIPSGGSTPYTYSWTGGCNQASCSNVCAGNYTVTITDADGCIKLDSAVVNQPTALGLTVSSTSSHCNKPDGSATATVTGGTGADTYTWTPGPGSGTAANNNITPGTYTILVHDTKGCADSATIAVPDIPGVAASITSSTNPTCFNGTDGSANVTANAGTLPYTYSWSPAPATGQGTPNGGGLSAGSYTCTVTDSSGCVSKAIIQLTQPAAVTVSPMAPVTLCITQCTPLTATGAGGTPGYTYTWVQNVTPVVPPVCPLVTTTYTVVATDVNACMSAPKLLTITVNPPLGVTAVPNSSICPGVSTTLGATATGGGGTYSYSWTPAAGLSNTTIANPVATPAVTTTYKVIVSDDCGTPTDSATVTVTVFPQPQAVILANDTVGCPPLCVTFTETSVPACQTAIWAFGDGTTFTGCIPPVHCYTTSGLYSIGLHVTDVNGCKAVANNANMINVYPTPKAMFSASPQPTTILNPGITFTNTTADTSCLWQWTFVDIDTTTSQVKNPTVYTYLDTGCYPVRLIAINHDGCKDTSTIQICIDQAYTFYAPNSFSPNDDNVNDIWVPKGEGIDLKNYALRIYDRWGNQVFATTTWGQGWNGSVNNVGQKAQIDIYVWEVDLKDFSRQPHHYKGIINMMK